MRLTQIKSACIMLLFLILFSSNAVLSQADKVTIVKNDKGMKLQVNSEDFMVNGINWDYFPRGENYSYSLWTQPDDFIKRALDEEMGLLKLMGVNAVRIYTGIQPKWIEYIHDNYGIYTILNHSFGRYGVTVDGVFISNTEYDDPKTRELLISEVTQMTEEFRNVRGLLMWLLGNENNYGLFWTGAETEDIPEGETIESVRARHMYKTFNDAIIEMKKIDQNHPVAICNGDVLFIDIIAEEVTDMDIYGTNIYRGYSFGDVFQVVQEKLNVPIFFTEFGSDAFDAVLMQEAEVEQAKYLIENWREIYENAYGKGKVGNSIGGMTFQFSDGWWKYDQETDLDVHNMNASWANGGYQFDYVEGKNNMNEEWFGVCAKGPTDLDGYYKLYPRAGYYALKEAHKLDIYNSGVDLEAIQYHFEQIDPVEKKLLARSDKAAMAADQLKVLRVSGLLMEFETISTGGYLTTTPEERQPGSTQRPAFMGFDHMQSFYAEIEANPAPNVRGKLSLNVLGNVPDNPINEIFYENRGQRQTVITEQGESLQLTGIDRVKVYQASVDWDGEDIKLNAFYRTGHYHWGYEGDMFGIYPEANYGPNIDIYNGEAPLGFEIAAKKSLEGLKIAFGPQLWWGANPAIIVKYSRKVGPVTLTGIFHEDLDEAASTVSSLAIPLPRNRRASLHAEYEYGDYKFEVGGFWSGSPRVDEDFQVIRGTTGDYQIYEDRVKGSDAWGGKAKFTLQSGMWNWYVEGAARSLVARGGVNPALTFTGYRLKDSGLENHYNVLTGLAVTLGDWQIAPNFLWQKPIEGPIPVDAPDPGRPRNVLEDPFAVLGQRETTAGEILFTYDPTPATWMYSWDSDVREDAPLAVSAGFVYRHQPTVRDANIGILTDGRTIFAFPGAPPAQDLWEAHARFVSKLAPGLGFIANIYGGTGQANGSDDRLIYRYGGDIRLALKTYKLIAAVKIDDWGPYDYHRDFNLTFPLQLMADLSTQVGFPEWFDLPQTRLGVRGIWRSMDQYSPRYCPGKSPDASGEFVCDPTIPGQPNGYEWEIRTYLHLNFGM